MQSKNHSYSIKKPPAKPFLEKKSLGKRSVFQRKTQIILQAFS
jgi:hypothetical protein